MSLQRRSGLRRKTTLVLSTGPPWGISPSLDPFTPVVTRREERWVMCAETFNNSKRNISGSNGRVSFIPRCSELCSLLLYFWNIPWKCFCLMSFHVFQSSPPHGTIAAVYIQTQRHRYRHYMVYTHKYTHICHICTQPYIYIHTWHKCTHPSPPTHNTH